MALNFFVSLLIGLALNIVAYLIMPKPANSQAQEYKDAEDPTAEAGKPIPLMSGSMTIKGLNILMFGKKSKTVRYISVGGK